MRLTVATFKTIAIILASTIWNLAQAQENFYFALLNSKELFRFNIKTQTSQKITELSFNPFDIAITKSGLLYGTDGSNIYSLNLENMRYGKILDLNINGAINALDAISEDMLWAMDQSGTFYLINYTLNTCTPIIDWSIGCLGDISLGKDGYVYMVGNNSNLYRLDLNSLHGKNLGSLDDMPSAFGIVAYNIGNISVRDKICYVLLEIPFIE